MLSEGEWFKIGVTQSGIHKLDFNFLQKAGINPAAINPKHIKLYGNGGGMLPQANQSFRYDDLAENAIYVEGETDNKFDNGDYILFYAQSPHSIYYDSTQKVFRHQNNLYSDTTFYFITIGQNPGLRITMQESMNGATHTIKSFEDYLFHEKDLTNQIGSGREWYGEKFDFTTSYTLDFAVPGIIPDSEIKITSAVMAQASASTQFALKLNEQSIGSQQLSGVSPDTYNIKGVNKTDIFTTKAQANSPTNLKINVSYDKKGISSAAGYLNYIGLQVKRSLQLYSNQTIFRSLESMAYPSANFQIDGANNQLKIWDITNPVQPRQQQFTLNASQAVFGAETNTLKEFILFTGSSFDSPVSIRRVSNQNLHALATPTLLIITADLFIEQAYQLANFRQQHDGLQVEVATVSQIFNEFSSGRQDVTAIRDFIRFLYLKSQSLQYVLLLGDASYDYKNRVSPNSNFVPIYESRESLHPIFSYSSDDYFGFMDEDEGEWTENMQGDHEIDIAIGRLPVKSRAEATNVVSKLIKYSTDAKTLGKWRKQICFVADDGDNNTHQLDADRLAEQIASAYPSYHVNKIFMDAYPQISNPNGQTAPEVQQALNNAIDKGHLIINYTGHGGEVGWATEQILTLQQINSWRNTNLPLLVTATCEFGRYDDPVQVSGAESALLHANGGAIGLITTTRPVFSNTNYALNTAFYKAIFEPQQGEMPRLGDAMKYTKNNSLSGSINRNFALLGDPSMRLAYPEEEVVIHRINDVPVNESADTLKALRKITIEGNIQHPFTKQLQTDFNGIISATVFDKKSIVTTFGTERSARMNFSVQRNIIFEGKASVKNGVFKISFVVPKDIDYRIGEGKISLYAQDDEKLWDAAGSQSVLVGGSIPQTIIDITPPQIRLFMNDTTFVSGGVTGSNTALLAFLSDENGINITRTGIGHEITATLSSEPNNQIILNAYFTTLTDNFQQGEVFYPFENLAAGTYTLTLKAWDTYNNSSEASLGFVVANSEQLALFHVLNAPNPLNDFTHFQFDHNRAGEDLEILVEIYTSSGQLVKTLQTTAIASPEQFRNLQWNAIDDNGNKLNNGIYIYKLSVRSMTDGAEAYKINKLIIMQ